MREVNDKSLHILIVEDNEGDIILTSHAFEEVNRANQVSVVRNGIEAMEFLNKKGKYSDAKTPQLILLDVNMPLMGGLEVLSQVKKQKHLIAIPIIVLTTSSSCRDIEIAYNNECNAYVTKPFDMDSLVDFAYGIQSFALYLNQ